MGKSKHKKHHRHDLDSDEGSSQDGTNGSAPSGSGLKLILKVGSSSSKSHSEKHKKKKKKKDRKKEKEHKHRHHHKEKSSRHPEPQLLLPPQSLLHDVILTAPTEYIPPPPPPPPQVEMVNLDVPMVEAAKPVPEPVPVPELIPKLEPEVHPSQSVNEGPLHKLLEYFHQHLQRKDVNHFFAMPVDDLFAPGYSEIIKEPMDFSTMQSKLNSGKYPTLAAFKHDFELMCNNACIYNTPDTVYYKFAKKLLYQGQKMFSLEKIKAMKATLPYVKYITEAELGFDITSEESPMDTSHGVSSSLISHSIPDDDVSKVIEDIREVIRRPVGRFEAIPDDMTPKEILDNVRAAARGAANRLRISKPKSRMGYLKQLQDGTTTMSFLPGGPSRVAQNDNERIVILDKLISTVKQGSGTIQIYREDRRNQLRGLYGPSGPNFDSVFSNLTADETEQVNVTYGDDVGVQYAESILNFSKSCDYAMFIVDHLLDILTGNEHRKTSKHIQEQKMLRSEDELLNWAFKGLVPGDEEAVPGSSSSVDFESLRSLSGVGIDMTFLDNLQQNLLQENQQ